MQKRKREKKSTKHMIKVESIIKRYQDDTDYCIRIKGPGQRFMKKKRIKDLADCSCEKHSISHPVLILITHEEWLGSITEQGYEALYDPPADGNCGFSAAANVFRNLELFRSAVTLRNVVINYLNTNNFSPDGFS